MAHEERGSAPARPQNIILEGRKKLNVTGVDEVLSFDENLVVMDTGLGELLVRGEELRVERLSVETGDLTILGHVAEMSYRDKRPRSGLWERLFG